MKIPQKQKLLELLQDGQPHRTDEICDRVYGSSHLGLARVGARVWDLNQEGKNIIGYKDKNNPALYWYQLVIPVIPQELKQEQLLTLSQNYGGY